MPSVDLPWKEVSKVVRPRPGNLVVVLGAPGVGKSTFALNWAYDIAEGGHPVLYLTYDTNLRDQFIRVAAKVCNVTVSQVDVWLQLMSEAVAEKAIPLRFCELTVDPDELRDLISAERAAFGETPAVVVIDCATDIALEGDDPKHYGKLFQELAVISREFSTVIVALHHIHRGPAAEGRTAPSKADGLYAGERPAHIVLGLSHGDYGDMRVNVAKNRMGETPWRPWFLKTDLSRANIWEDETPRSYVYGR
jgi:hypothetical protein